MGSVGLHLGGVCAFEMAYISRVFDERHVHPEADTEEGNALLAGITHRFNLSLNTAITEAARYKNGIQMRQQANALSLDLLSIDIVDFHPGISLQARMIEGFIQRLISIDQVNIFANHAYTHRTLTLTELAPDHVFPLRQVSRRLDQPKALENIIIEPALLQVTGYLINRVRIHKGDHGPLFYVGEQGDLAACALVHFNRAAAQQHFGLQTNRAQFLDRVLGRLGFDFTGSRNVRNKREVHKQRIGRPQLQHELTHCLEEGLAFNVACGAAYFHHGDLGIPRSLDDPIFDLVSDVRNHLNGAAQVIAPAFLAQHRVVYAACCKVIGTAHHGTRESLVVTQI